MSAAAAVTAAEFADLVAGPVPVLVDFWAEWCGPCRQVAPVVDQLAAELGERVRVVKVDLDAFPEVAAASQVTSVPTLIVFRGGEQVWRTSGAKPYGVLLPQVTAALS